MERDDMYTNEYEQLLDYLKGLQSVAVAFSGGVDSSFLAYAAQEALGDKAVAITVSSPYIPNWEIEEARQLADEIGIRHVVIEGRIPEIIMENPSNRCYLCKRVVFSKIIEEAKSLGMEYVVDGSNFDDTKDYRPGLAALKELNVKSPLMECNWTKDMIRHQSMKVKLATHDKPAYACLLTRIPYDTLITTEELEKIEKSEVYLMGQGFRAVRVRSHDDLARIEVAREDRERMFDIEVLDRISEELKSYGYRYVAVEASGYTMGSFNQQILEKEQSHE